MLSLIVAMDETGVIGAHGTLPWHLSSDLKHFKSLTWGKSVIMGRKTYASIGRPLPGRDIIVISKNGIDASEVRQVNSVARALEITAGQPEVFIAGGASIYAATIAQADRIYLTEVHTQCVGDTLFPDFNRSVWREISRMHYLADSYNEHAYSFVTLDRKD